MKNNDVLEDYAQNANTLFHFVNKSEFLKEILENKVLFPRYSSEIIDYLGLENQQLREIFILDICFCDIPLSSIFKPNVIKIANENKFNSSELKKLKKLKTHIDIYGGFGIALNKQWGEEKGLQLIEYKNTNWDLLAENIVFDAFISRIEKYEDHNEIYYMTNSFTPLFLTFKGFLNKNDFQKELENLDKKLDEYKNAHQWSYYYKKIEEEAIKKIFS